MILHFWLDMGAYQFWNFFFQELLFEYWIVTRNGSHGFSWDDVKVFGGMRLNLSLTIQNLTQILKIRSIFSHIYILYKLK